MYKYYAYIKLHIDIDVHIKTFPSWVAFTAWKEEEEQSTYSYFIQPKGTVESEVTRSKG